MVDSDLTALIEPLARAFYGEPNRRLSGKVELRFGTNGSLSIDIKQGTWFDFESNEGGGVLDLIKRAKGFTETKDCFVWMESNGFWTNGKARANGNGGSAQQQQSTLGKEVATYDYVDETGNLLFQVVRYDPKEFRQRAPDGNGGWTWRVRGIRQVPYRLPEILEALANERLVAIVEGEKDADNLWALGIPATTNAGGAGKWRDALSQFFIDADVVIIADNDPQSIDKDSKPLFHPDGRPKLPGFDHAHGVAATLAEKAARVRVLDLGKWWLDCPPKGDISDWIEAGGTIEALNDTIEKVPDWSFDQATKPKEQKDRIDSIPVIRPFPLDESTIPPRDWAVPGLLMRRHVTVLVAPSGSGKSLLTIQMAFSFADGQPWANWRPRGKLRCMIVNSEDDIDEMRRRFAAATRLMNIDQTNISDNIILAENLNGIIIAKFQASTKTLVQTPMLDELVQTITKYQIDWLIVDPFAETFQGDENDNSELKWAGILWREVARRTNSAIMLVHHTKKYASAMAGDVDAARGASALIGIARIVSTLFPMTKPEAELMAVKEETRGDFLRYDDAKANLNRKSPYAKWFQKRTITLNNSQGDIPADEVGALEPWTPVGAFDNITDDAINEFWRKLDEGMVDSNGRLNGEFYTLSSRKTNENEISRYVGGLVSDVFKVEGKRVTEIIKTWKDNNRFKEYEYISPRQRKPRTCVHSVDWKQPPPPQDNVLPFAPPEKPK